MSEVDNGGLSGAGSHLRVMHTAGVHVVVITIDHPRGSLTSLPSSLWAVCVSLTPIATYAQALCMATMALQGYDACDVHSIPGQHEVACAA